MSFGSLDYVDSYSEWNSDATDFQTRIKTDLV